MQLSVIAPAVHPQDAERYADLVEAQQLDRLWMGHNVVIDSTAQFGYLAGRGYRIPVGTSVTLAPMRHPVQAAAEARSLAVLFDSPVVAAFGPGSRDLQTGLLGRHYRSPLTAMAEYLQIVRGLLAGEVVDVEGSYHFTRAAMVPFPAPPVRVGLGVLRPGMAELAARYADVAVTWLASAAYLDNELGPRFRDPDRELNSELHVASVVHTAVIGEEDSLTDVVLSACGNHLQAPHYRDMLRRSGIELTDDPARNARALVAGGAFLCGSVEEVMDGLAAYQDAGVDELILNPLGAVLTRGADVASTGLRDLLDAWAQSPANRALAPRKAEQANQSR